jgi:2'-5' RNA ligase
MSLLRTFIAIEIPTEIRKAIARHSAGLQETIGRAVRWVMPENIHLTLKFIGDTSPASVDLLTQAMRLEAKNHTPFDMRIADLGVFPSQRHPRVLWVGLHAPPQLEHLQHGIEAAAARLGYQSEDKPFSPHLTIGRVRDQVSSAELQTIRGALDKTRIGDLGTARVFAIHLFRSDLQPGGSVYTRLFSAPLDGESH